MLLDCCFLSSPTKFPMNHGCEREEVYLRLPRLFAPKFKILPFSKMWWFLKNTIAYHCITTLHKIVISSDSEVSVGGSFVLFIIISKHIGKRCTGYVPLPGGYHISVVFDFQDFLNNCKSSIHYKMFSH